MTNAELIDSLRNVYGEKADCYHCHSNMGCYGSACMEYLCHAAADALEEAEKRIADLETALAACRARRSEKRIAELEAQLPKEGEWVWDADTGIYRCSECGGASPQEDQDGEYIDCPNYCPNCGAKMRGEHDEA